MGRANAQFLREIRINHRERSRVEKPGNFQNKREPNEQYIKTIKKVRAPLAHISEGRIYSDLKLLENGVEHYGDMKFEADKVFFQSRSA